MAIQRLKLNRRNAIIHQKKKILLDRCPVSTTKNKVYILEPCKCLKFFAVSAATNTICPFLIFSDLPHIQLQDVTTSQLIAYDTDRDLLPLILAQCNYSLEVGRGTLVQYNWDAIERQLIDRFIRRRPLIDFKVNCRISSWNLD